ncbi:MAG: dihydrofolate reductase [Myxococcales bacterium]|nr:dihydrofolate reductase [Myxococcales bacterium]
MTRFCVYIATSLDGFIARADGGLDWLSLVEAPGEDYGFHAFLEGVDTLVLGRATYDAVLGFGQWPYAGKRCVVLTHGALTSRHGEEAFSGTAEALAERLSTEGARRVYVDGGVVIGQFLDAGLVSELTLSVVPVLLGGGVRLFGSRERDVRLDLVRSARFPSGLVQSEYRVRRA